jgi:hypothetical protein
MANQRLRPVRVVPPIVAAALFALCASVTGFAAVNSNEPSSGVKPPPVQFASKFGSLTMPVALAAVGWLWLLDSEFSPIDWILRSRHAAGAGQQPVRSHQRLAHAAAIDHHRVGWPHRHSERTFRANRA